MPVTVDRRGQNWRVIDDDGQIAENESGTPLDGGGHGTKEEAKAQARAVNAESDD